MMTSGGSCGGGAEAAGVAPFVAKTYGMVEDPATNGVIAWGSGSNSFVVIDPFVFSQTLLPTHFKHSNFSSFVRQLNTYGFRKVDPDKWEFAHVSFLRGQTHLLRQIVRRSSSGGKRKDDGSACAADEHDDDGAMVAMEVARLKQEQKAIEDRVAAMWRRVQETERRPKQMLAFLLKVVGDPQVLRRLVASTSSSSNSSSNGSSGGSEVGFHGGGPAEGAEVKRPRLLLHGDHHQRGARTMPSSSPVESAGIGSGGRRDGFLYGAGVGEETFVPEPGVDFTGFYTGGDGFGDGQADAGGGGDLPYAFPVDSGY